jgi:hypothetical protein
MAGLSLVAVAVAGYTRGVEDRWQATHERLNARWGA